MILSKFICYVVYSLLVTVFAYYVDFLYSYNYYKDWLFCDFKNNTKYDFIVVGAGSAGSLIAARLSASGAKILLVEAGGPPAYFFNIPVIAPLLVNTVYDWKYKTTPQKNACLGLLDNVSSWPAGKILGGSGRLNNMIHMRGHPDDYKPWFSDYQRFASDGDGLSVTNQNWHSNLTDFILEGVSEISKSYLGKEMSAGFMRANLTIINGERWSTAWLLQKASYKKLKILSNSIVTKIIFKKTKAVGVKFLKNGQNYRAFSRKGVILSAGAVGTPKLLMISGIGPKGHLDKLNIKTIVDLPVGHHLQDHIITGLDLVTIESNEALSIADILNPYSLVQYYFFGKGPWTSAGADVVGTFHSKYQKDKSAAPDLQIMTLPVGISQDNGVLLRKNLQISDKIFDEYFRPLAYKTSITIAPVLLHPKSFGEIRLNSADPFDAPVIDPKYLSDELDVLTLIEGIEFIKKLVDTKAMKKIGAKLYKKSFPGCENFIFDTLDYWKCYVRHLTLTTYHPVGSCRIGSVVDEKFRVLKTKNLFVVDASVFPNLPSGNINGPIIMLSEKAVKMFRNYFHESDKNKCHAFDIFLFPYNCF